MTEEERQRSARIVAFATVLVDLPRRIGDDHDAVVPVRPVGQCDFSARLVTATHRELATLRDGCEQPGTRERAIDGQIDPVDPVAAGRCGPDVRDRPRDGDRFTGRGRRWHGDGLHRQICRRHGHNDARCQRRPRVVVLECGLVDPGARIGAHDEVHAARNAEGYGHACRTGVGLTRRNRTIVSKLSKQRVGAIEHGVARQVDRITPADCIRHRVAEVAYAPDQRCPAAFVDRRRPHRDIDLQVRIWGVQLDHARRQPGVVGPRVGLEHLTEHITDHAEIEGALQPLWHRDAVHGFVAFVDCQCATVGHGRKHDVIAVADHIVAAQHDAIRPRRLRGRDRAVVLYRPADFDSLTTACCRRGSQRLHHQVRVVGRGGVAHDHGLVVALGIESIGCLAHLVAHIGDHRDLDVTRSPHPGWQHEHELPGTRLAGRRYAATATRRRIERQLRVEQQLAGRGIAHHDTIAPASRRRAIAGVQVVPRHGHRRPGLQFGRQHREIRHPQVRCRGDRELCRVVALCRPVGIALRDLLAHVRTERELEAPDRVVATWPGERGAALDVRTRRKLFTDSNRCSQRGVVDQCSANEIAYLDAVRPRYGHGRVAGVAHTPAQGHRAARSPACRRLQDQIGNHQIRVARQF